MSLHDMNCKTFSDAFVNEGITYLLTGHFPEHVRHPSQRQRFTAKYKGFRVQRDALYYGGRRVVSDRDRDDILRAHYERIGDIGRDRFFNYLKTKYLGITRRQTATFVANQELHQLSLPVRRQKVSKPIVASRPMERWQADLIYMKAYKSPQNKHATFVLTVLDCFSKKAWAVPVTRKTSQKVAAAMGSVFHEHGAPRIVQTDVGREFLQEFDITLKEWKVKHVTSNPYSPATNGQIERFNGTLKRQIKAYMRRHNTRIYVPALQGLVDAYNDVPHTTTKMAPSELHHGTTK